MLSLYFLLLICLKCFHFVFNVDVLYVHILCMWLLRSPLFDVVYLTGKEC